jgi:site-specific DNA recombinase
VEAPVVRWVYERYTIDGLSIGAITRLLNEQRIPTRKQTGRWERLTVWAMLRQDTDRATATHHPAVTPAWRYCVA